MRNLFLNAYYHMLKNEVSFGTPITIGTGHSRMDAVLKAYRQIIEDIPFPLSYIEENIKYCAIYDGLMEKLDNEYTEDSSIWVDDGICVYIEGMSSTAYRIKGEYYIAYKVESKPDYQLSDFRQSSMYEQFDWLSTHIREGSSISSFYKTFMKDVVQECSGDIAKFEHRIMHFTEYEEIENSIEIPEDKIVFGGNEIMLDIFYSMVPIEGKYSTVHSLDDDSPEDTEYQAKRRILNCNVYAKIEGKEILPCNIDSFKSILLVMNSNANVPQKMPYKGIVIDNDIVFECNNNIYYTKYNIFSAPMLIINNAHIKGYCKDKLYIVRKEPYKDVYLESIYKYQDKKLELCREELTK